MPTVHIRRAREEDIDTLLRLFVEFHEFHVRGLPDRLCIPQDYDLDGLRASLKRILNDENAAIFLAEHDSEPVEPIGLAEVYMRQDMPEPLIVAKRFGHLQSLMVLQEWRKHGVGSRLVTAAEQWARERGATEMQLNAWEFAAGPLHFYETLQYRTLKRTMVKDI